MTEGRFRTSDGVTLVYDDIGQGPALLCLAGLTRNARDFDYVAPHLSAYRLICLDYRGRGRSDHAPVDSYCPAVEARDVLELMAHLQLPQTAILGTSRGGLVAMVLAAHAKEVLTGVILNDIGPEIAAPGLDKIKDYLGRPLPHKTLEALAVAYPAAYPEFSNVPPGRWRDEAARRAIETPDGLVLNYDTALREAVLGQGAQPVPDLWPLFQALEGVPLGLIRGARSDLLSSATAAEMCRRRPDMIFAEVPGRGHVPFLDEPESLAVINAVMAKATAR